jgi:hypothetical protein
MRLSIFGVRVDLAGLGDVEELEHDDHGGP